MNNEKLIELVREYTFLYDLSDRRYSDSQRKDDAWKEIAEKLQVQENHCKKSWALLRDAFRRSIKKQKETKSGQASRSIRKWKYEDEMSFLLPYFKERNTLCTVPVTHENKDGDDEETGTDEDIEEGTASSEVNIKKKKTLSKQTNVAQPSTSKQEHIISGSSPNYNTPVLKQGRIRQTTLQSTSSETPSTALMKFILENKTKPNDIQQFFDGMATTVQSFPPRDRVIAKAKVFAVISQMELEIVGRDSSTSSGYICSPASCETQMSESRQGFNSTPSPQPISSEVLEHGNASQLSGYNNRQERGLGSLQDTPQNYPLENYFTSYAPQ